jgi:hypothetical protein
MHSLSLYLFLDMKPSFTLLVLYTIWNFDTVGLRVHAPYQSSFAFKYCVMPGYRWMSHCNSLAATTIVQPPLFQRQSCNSEDIYLTSYHGKFPPYQSWTYQHIACLSVVRSFGELLVKVG